MERSLICPQCKAPLKAHRFIKQVVCGYCGTTVNLDDSAVSTAGFRDAFQGWNSPGSYAFASTTTIESRHWAVEKMIAKGEAADIYLGRLARWPTELVLLKVLRENQNHSLLENEWKSLKHLHDSNARGAETFVRLLPHPIVNGKASLGAFAGRQVSVFQWAGGFYYSCAEVKKAYPQGIGVKESIWIWRRILEMLAFLHSSGVAHGALLPQHLLIQKNEHGVRLVGYGHSGYLSDPLTSIEPGYEPFYPDFAKTQRKLTTALDIVMSSRCIIDLLGGKPDSAELPAEVPQRLAEFLRRIALASRDELIQLNAWQIREEVGAISAAIFGPPSFHPIKMPGWSEE